MKPCWSPVWGALLLLGLLCPSSTAAQEGGATRTDAARTARNGVSRVASTSPCFEWQDSEQGRQRENKVIANLPEFARFWLTEDVVYLISPQERSTFLQMATDEERSQFIEQFWSRRAPDPTSLENSFKKAHYERIALADEKYGTQMPGWKTDRGRIYVTFGPPDSVESHRAGEKNDKAAEDGVETFPYPWEGWQYKHLEGIGENVEIGFVDQDGSGNYRLALSPEAKDASIITPPDNLVYSRSGKVTPESAQPFELCKGPAPTPLVQFKDLEAMVVSRIVRDQVRFSHRIEFAKATNATTLARILVYLSSEQLSSPSNDQNPSTGYEVFGRISKPSGWVVETFEHKISLDGRRNSAQHQPDCQFNVAIAAGTYQLAIVVKNIVTRETGTLHTEIEVPSHKEIDRKK